MVHIDRIKRLVWGALMAVTCLVVSPAQVASQLYFIHNDHLGTPQAVTDQNQNIVWRKHQKPFGETTEETGTEDPQLRFPGQYFDEETGYHYNYFRDYDPTTGRYIQSDPIGILKDFSNPQLQVVLGRNLQSLTSLNSLNHLYGYVDQNPLNFFDFFGLFRGCIEIEPKVFKCPDGGPDINDGRASAFPASTNDDCVKRCVADKITQCTLPGRKEKPNKEMAMLIAACAAAALLECSNQTCDKCDDKYK